MKSLFLGIVGAIIIAVIAGFVFDSMQMSSSDRFTVHTSAKL